MVNIAAKTTEMVVEMVDTVSQKPEMFQWCFKCVSYMFLYHGNVFPAPGGGISCNIAFEAVFVSLGILYVVSLVFVLWI